MKTLLIEHQVTCPSCWEQHRFVADLTDEQRTLIEDCQVCCNPMQISFEVEGDDLSNIEAEPLY